MRLKRAGRLDLKHGIERLILRLIAVSIAVLMIGACSSLPTNIEPLPEQSALPPATMGVLADMDAKAVSGREPDRSGFRLLDNNADGLTWRLALIDEATSSLDLMYYLWHADNGGRLLLRRAIQAADRGVSVRFIIDDLLLSRQDRVLAALHEHPNIQLRIFNPWVNRKAGRGLEFVTRLDQLNSRMHNKLLIADNHAVILGGRNIGDHYFGLSESYNFRDLDVLGLGPVARQASAMFDHYWNSNWVISAAVLPDRSDEAFVARTSREFREKLQSSEALAGFPLEPQDWTEALGRLGQGLHFGSSSFVYDRVEEGELVGGLTEPLGHELAGAEREILLVNAYFLPNQQFLDGMKRTVEGGVQIRILTNSLASHDVPAVNSHYQKWRKPILRAGSELYELRSDPAIKSSVDTAPVVAQFVGLHTKSFVVDRRTVFIGSMNFDPRSLNINTEMGVLIDSASLGEELAELMIEDMDPANAWQVKLTAEGKLVWVNSDETVTRQPARNFWQRIMDVLLKILPESQV